MLHSKLKQQDLQSNFISLKIVNAIVISCQYFMSILLIWLMFYTNALAVPDPVIDIACRPDGNATDSVRISWKDTNADAADYIVQRQNIAGGSWSTISTLAAGSCDDNDNCEYIDNAASSTTVYRNRVIADDGNDQSTSNPICREPTWLDSTEGNYRIYYRINECPDVDGDQVCTENINTQGSNKHALQMANIFEQYRTEYMNIVNNNDGFNDPAFFDGGKPFPVDLYPCNNGCANSRGIQVPPKKLEPADYDPATGTGNDFEYFIPGHEIFHKVQGAHGNSSDPFYKWVIEGQARAMEDKACVFTNLGECDIWDDDVDKFYDGQMAAYLGQPEVGLQEQSYNAAIFWVKVMEEFATLVSEPELGSDVMRDFWVQNENNNPKKDGIETLNDALDNIIGSSRRFIDIFKDFVVANYAKDYLSFPIPVALQKYNYIDEETFPGGSYGSVKLTTSSILNLNQVVFGTKSIDAWGARYFEIQPDSSVPVINIEVKTLAATQNQLYFHVLGLNAFDEIVYQHSATGTSYEHSVSNIAPIYSRIALVVASLGQQTNFDYGFNLSDGLFIQSPDNQFPAKVGEATSPKKFTVRLKVLGKDGEPEAGIDPNDFVISIDGNQIYPTPDPMDSPLIAASYLGGQYWLVLRAPASPGCDPCDLTAEYSSFTDTKIDALEYGPTPSVDNMIVIDRSGSMAGDKIAAAKEAGQLYVDAYDTGDRIGVLSYAETPNSEFSLTAWDLVSRAAAQTAIDTIAAPFGGTANGSALREGLKQLANQNSPNPEWAMVLLSDGKDSVAETDDHIAKFISEYKIRKDDGDQIPVIHVVAVGDDADGVELEKLISISGGQFQWLSEVGAAPAAAITANAVLENLSTELAEIYRVFAETVSNEQQIFAKRENVQSGVTTNNIKVDQAASQAVFVFKWAPSNLPQPFIRLLQPDGSAINPTLSSAGHLVWRVPTPTPGDWKMVFRPCSGSECAHDFLTEASLISDLTLQVFLGLPVEDRLAGKPMTIMALLSDIKAIIGSTLTATVPRTGETLTLHDDGAHNDGAANDGFYGGTILNTNQAGGYTVIINANGNSNLGDSFVRRARIGFFMKGDPDDPDRDGLPTWWEKEHGLDPEKPNVRDDPDKDGLTTFREYILKTHPLDADTDDGGENDGSEVQRGSNPLFANDDIMSPPRAKAWAGVGKVNLKFSESSKRSATGIPAAKTVDIYAAIRDNLTMKPYRILARDIKIEEGEWIDHINTNWEVQPPNTVYCYCVIAKGAGASAPSNVTCATPRLDPYPPHGEVDIEDHNVANLPMITLTLMASDDPNTDESLPFEGQLLDATSIPSGVKEMMVSNRADFKDETWQPYQLSLQWSAAFQANGNANVFVKYRDAAGNESELVAASIHSEQMIDTDEDGIPDTTDNCPLIANASQENSDADSLGDVCDNCTKMDNEAQRDTDKDNFGNHCDADFNNNCIVDANDFTFLKRNIFTADPDADLNGNGIVDANDFSTFKNWIFHPPGPSGFGICVQ